MKLHENLKKIHENHDPHTADNDEEKSATLSYVFVIDDENHKNHEIMCGMSTPKWTPPIFAPTTIARNWCAATRESKPHGQTHDNHNKKTDWQNTSRFPRR